MKSPRIIWESRAPVVPDCFHQRRLLPAANGGNAYDVQAAWQLEKDFQLTVSKDTVIRPGEGPLSYWSRMRRIRHQAEVVIREPYPIVFGRFTPGVKYIGVIHHIDERQSRSSLRHRWFFSRLLKRLSALDLVVTVSEYGAQYLRGVGCRNVRVIYNSFDPSEYAMDPQSVARFRQKYSLPSDKPVIYIGNASRQKGVYEVYQALKDQPYHLVMSGPQNKASDLPVSYLRLDRDEYILLLHACSAVISMSNMTEGWNRIAHEAMLCRVPVIGNGAGGMLELLQGGSQAIVHDISTLPAVVENVLQNRDEYAADGYRYVLRFNLEYFRKSWSEAVRSVLS